MERSRSPVGKASVPILQSPMWSTASSWSPKKLWGQEDMSAPAFFLQASCLVAQDLDARGTLPPLLLPVRGDRFSED